MKKFFSPKSVAVVGASRTTGKVGNSLAKHLLEFKGDVYFVNDKDGELFGKKTFKSLKEVGKVDLVLIAVPDIYVLDILKDCECKCVVIISAFENNKLRDKVMDYAKSKKIRIIGPNCFGIVNTWLGLNTTFSKSIANKGNIGFVSQSGALWSYISEYSLDKGIGFSKFISLGDMTDVNFLEVVEYLGDDKESDVILCYIEQLKEGRGFMKVISAISKPVIVVKGGKSEAGVRAAMSHTSSLAGSYDVYSAGIKQAGGFFVDSIEEGLILAKRLCYNKFKGNRAVILTNAGGPGILVSDNLSSKGYEVVKLPTNFKLDIKGWSQNNPIDIVGDATAIRYKLVLDKLSKENFYDIAVVLLTPQDMTDVDNIAYEVIKFKKKSGKDVVCGFLGEASVKDIEILLEKEGIVNFRTIQDLDSAFYRVR